jgi:hypothetical protein
MKSLPLFALPLLLAACSGFPSLPAFKTAETPAPLPREVARAVTVSNHLIAFNAGRPERLLSRKFIAGLQPGEKVLGIDFRQKGDQLYALGDTGRLYTIDHETAVATAVGAAPVALKGTQFGFDFNPTVDRIRVASAGGQNLRLHPDTGALAGTDTDFAYPSGAVPRVLATAYTYNNVDPKITTMYVIDGANATLGMVGSREGAQPVVSPNTGRLTTIGPLAVGPFETASFDIHVLTNRAFAVLGGSSGPSRWVAIDLATGRGQVVGLIGGGEPVVAFSFESW